MKSFLLPILLFVCAFTVSAASKTIFEWDFTKGKRLDSWNYFNTMPSEENFKFEQDDTGSYLASSALYGMSHQFSEPVIVDDRLKKLEVMVTLRQPQSPAHIISLAVSSRQAVCPSSSWPFERRMDSGILAAGCGFNSQSHHYMYWQKDGSEVIRTIGGLSPRNLSAWGQWVTWRLVLDHEAKSIACYSSLEPERPKMILHGTDLSGIVLQSVFLSGLFAQYKQLAVTVETK